MKAKTQNKPAAAMNVQKACHSAVEEIIEKKLDDLATILSVSDNGKSKLHEEVMAMVEKGLFKIALRRSSYVKSTAAAYLGINRNTFTDKMAKLGIDCEKIK
ncbi:MAG: helix-turn-helix domain-containing protein [Smithella sp.]|jgi:DNA-binding NtrC family response regulator